MEGKVECDVVLVAADDTQEVEFEDEQEGADHLHRLLLVHLQRVE